MAYTATMARRHKLRSGLALSGLGCGWFETRPDGSFQKTLGERGASLRHRFSTRGAGPCRLQTMVFCEFIQRWNVATPGGAL